jgi:hypothetical protein
MPISLPNLDDMTYNDLVAEAVARIPGLTDAWTDFNPTDPGIVLVEMFAWLTEMLIFQTNQVTDHQRLTFLKLLNGPDRNTSLIAETVTESDLDKSTANKLLDLLYPETPASGARRPPDPIDLAVVDAGVRATITAIRRVERVVTTADYVDRVLRKFKDKVAWVKAVPRRDLESGGNGGQANESDHMSVLVVPHHFVVTDAMLAALDTRRLHTRDPEKLKKELRTLKSNLSVSLSELWDRVIQGLGSIGAAQDGPTILQLASAPAKLPPDRLAALLKQVKDDLASWKVLTTRLHVLAPRYRTINPLVSVARRTDSTDDAVAKAVANALIDFFHPVFGGPDGQGWPFGGAIFLSDLYRHLATVPGVDYIPEITLYGDRGLEDPFEDPSFYRNADGELLGILLDPDELPALPDALVDLAHVDQFIAVAGPFDARAEVKDSTFRPRDRVGFVALRLEVTVKLKPALNEKLHTPVFTAIKCRLGDRFRPVGPTNVGQRLDGTRAWKIVWKIVPLPVERSRDNLAVTVISLEDKRRELENDLNDLRFALLPLEEALGVGRIRLTFSCDGDSPWFDSTDGSLSSHNDEMVELQLTVKQAAS